VTATSSIRGEVYVIHPALTDSKCGVGPWEIGMRFASTGELSEEASQPPGKQKSAAGILGTPWAG
jgi:hypothetical protein